MISTNSSTKAVSDMTTQCDKTVSELVDDAIASIKGQSIVSVLEMIDVLLDIRNVSEMAAVAENN